MILDCGMSLEMVERLAELVPTVKHENNTYIALHEADGDSGVHLVIYAWEQSELAWIPFDSAIDAPKEVIKALDQYGEFDFGEDDDGEEL